MLSCLFVCLFALFAVDVCFYRVLLRAFVMLLIKGNLLCTTLHQEPMIQAVFPAFGPRSGGTQLSVRGQHLDIGSQLLVYASSQPCTVVRYCHAASWPQFPL